MKILEIRRHGMRKQGGGSQLSQQGVSEARKLGASLGPFATVVTSVVPRARETAIAMGFAVDYEIVSLVSEDAFYEEAEQTLWWHDPQPFASLASVIARKGAIWRYAHGLVAMWRDILMPLPDDSAALLIGHSGELEIALVACFPNADHTSWGEPFGLLEGARLQFGGEPEHFITFEFVRT